MKIYEGEELRKLTPFGRGWMYVKRVIVRDADVAYGYHSYLPFGNLLDHFDRERGYPNVEPGVILVELANITSLALTFESAESENTNMVPQLKGLEGIRFKGRPVMPGEDLVVVATRNKRSRLGLMMVDFKIYRTNVELEIVPGTYTSEVEPCVIGQILAGFVPVEVLQGLVVKS